jgi:hypothetical protein
MPNPSDRHISLADLAEAGLRLRPTEAATIARDLALRAASGDLPGIPSAHVIRFGADGSILVEGPVGADREVERAARLLEALLPGFDAPPEFRVPGALRLVLARALGTLDLPPYVSLQEFADALGRFSAANTATCVREIVTGWAAALIVESEPDASPSREGEPRPTAELTISDVRRARRATRLTLADISERTRIPVELLREFEWGYFANWPSGFYGRTQIVRYARAAGLDERVVIDAVLPSLDLQPKSDTTVAAAPAMEMVAVEPVGPPPLVNGELVEPAAEYYGTSLVRSAPAEIVPVRRNNARHARWAAALAIPALVGIGLVPAYWNTRPAPALEAPAAKATPVPRPSIAREQRTEAPPAAPAAERAKRATFTEPQVEPRAVATAGFSPAFASAGSAMFYHADARDGSAIMRADTDVEGAVLRVTSVVDDRGRNFHARPSPDGSRIAFDSDRDGERGVYVADASGENVRRISGDGFAAVPSWSPDGRQLTFVRSEPGHPRVWNIWTVDLASGATTRVTAHRVGQPWGGAWFPDGRRIAYSHETRLIVKALDGSTQRIFNSPVRGRMIRTPAVSPDGKRIIFQVYRNGAWLLDLPDGSMRRVLDDASAEEFTWSPDGRRVAYHSRRSGTWGVWVMAAR